MRSRFAIIAVLYFLSGPKNCYGHVYPSAKIVTYGEPCDTHREYPIRIEGPIHRRMENLTPLELSFSMIKHDSCRGKTFGYEVAVPPTKPTLHASSSKHYNFGVYVPPSRVEAYSEQLEENIRAVRPLKGLTTRIDRILVPACEEPTSRRSIVQKL